MSRERILFLEIGRTVSIFLVILLHACLGSYYLFKPEHDINWHVTLAYYVLSSVSVPIFVMISGVTTVWLKCGDNKKNNISVALNRVKKLILPVVVWSIVYLILLNQFSSESLLKILWSPQGLVHLWFLYMLIGLYLLSPIVSLLFNSSDYSLAKYILITWFLFSSVGTYFEFWQHSSLGTWFGLFSNYQSGFIGYYILGAYMMTRPAISFKLSILIFTIGLLSSYFLVLWDNIDSSVFNSRFLNFLTPNVLLMSFGFISLLRSITWSMYCGRYALYMSPLVIGVYLTHEMVLKFCREYFGLVGYGYSAIYFIPLLTIFSTVIALLFSFFLKSIQGKYRIFF